jgi:hypothetical protein
VCSACVVSFPGHGARSLDCLVDCVLHLSIFIRLRYFKKTRYYVVAFAVKSPLGQMGVFVCQGMFAGRHSTIKWLVCRGVRVQSPGRPHTAPRSKVPRRFSWTVQLKVMRHGKGTALKDKASTSTPCNAHFARGRRDACDADSAFVLRYAARVHYH